MLYGSQILVVCAGLNMITFLLVIPRYLDNIVSHPGEDKYCRIRLKNKAFQDRVVGVPGAMLFLKGIGFHQQLLPHQGMARVGSC